MNVLLCVVRVEKILLHGVFSFKKLLRNQLPAHISTKPHGLHAVSHYSVAEYHWHPSQVYTYGHSVTHKIIK